MVGIVGILLLGSLAWSAVGALASAVGAASSALRSANPPQVTLAPVAAVTPSPTVVAVAVVATPSAVTASPTAVPSPVATATPAPAQTATPVVAARNPWILLPQPEPGAKVPPGPITVEARGRGDVPIKAMRLEMDGAALAVAFEQRNEFTWRGSASTRVAAGQHNVRAVVTDADGRTGSFRWTFTAAPAP
jgi:hypothetical protein